MFLKSNPELVGFFSPTMACQRNFRDHQEVSCGKILLLELGRVTVETI